MAKEKKLEEKVWEYKLLESRLNQLLQQKGLMLTKLKEIEITSETLEEIEKVGEKDILISIGSLTYAPAKLVKSGKVIVEVGAGAVLEKTFAEAKKLLEKRKRILENAVEKLSQEISNVAQAMQLTEEEIAKLQKQS